MRKVYALLPVMIFVSSLSVNAQSENKKELPPPPPPPKVSKIETQKEPSKMDLVRFSPPIVIVKGNEADDFYKRNPNVTEIQRQGNTVILKQKDGTTEKFNFMNENEKKRFTDKYGALLIPPPPPPPKKPVKS